MGESKGRGKPRNMNRGLLGTDNSGGLTVGAGDDRGGESQRGKR